MKLNPSAIAVFGLLASLLFNTAAMADDPTFEQIEMLTTSLEPWGNNMVNRGDGYFYGAARWAQKQPAGAIFRIAPHQPAEILHTFASIPFNPSVNAGGSNPSSGLVLGPDGALYGATEWGGANALGTIYRISADGAYTVIHDFAPGEGAHANSLIFTSTGELYGTTSWGGSEGGGTLFRIGTDGVFQLLYSFKDHPGARNAIIPYSPFALHEGPDGIIYGLTRLGAKNAGYVQGVFFRYNGPGDITVLTGLVEALDPLLSATAPDGIYVTNSSKLVHLSWDGTETVAQDFAPANSLDCASLLVTLDGVYAITYKGGSDNSGFIYRYVPDEGTTVLHNFGWDSYGQQRCLAMGNDGLIYGLVAPPQNYIEPTSVRTLARSAVALSSSSPAKKGGTIKPRTFRFRELANQSPNFVPVAKPDIAWLPANALNSQRSVIVDVLLNDRDPDGNPLTLTSILPPVNATADIVSVAGRPKLRFTTLAPDPGGQNVQYQISDGNGGSSIGTVTILSPVTGKFSGTATDTSTPPAPNANLVVTMGSKNSVAVTFSQGTVRYSGKGVLGPDETANISLPLKGKQSMNLRLILQRGTPRQFSATVQGGGSIYTATCLPAGK